MAQHRIHYPFLNISLFNKHVPFALLDPLSAFLHLALCSGRLTCMNYISRLPCPLTPIWVQPIEPWPKIRGREERKVSALVALAPSLQGHIGLDTSSNWRLVTPIQDPLMDHWFTPSRFWQLLPPLTFLTWCSSRCPSLHHSMVLMLG